MRSQEFRLLTGLIFGAGLAGCLWAEQFRPEDAPFARAFAESYSSYKNERGEMVNPRWGEARIHDFGSREVRFESEGMRKLADAPAPGVHPRVLFSPEDLPDIRERLKNTRAGQQAWRNILSWVHGMKGTYEETADYARPDRFNGSFGGLRGPVPLFRLGLPNTIPHKGHTNNPNAAAAWRGLVEGTAEEFPPFYWNTMALEAFRCLIEDDADGARELAKAAMTAMRIEQARREIARKEKGATLPPDQPVGGFQFAFIYDFLSNWLTPEQRQAMQAELAETTWSHDNYGTFNDAHGSRSNWATFSYWLFQVLAIEDEPGFNELKVRGMYRGWRNLLTYGWYPSGATFEGEAKNQLGMDGILPFARRSERYGFENLAGHPHLRAYATRFLPHSIIPTRDGFIKYDLIGGSRSRGGGFSVCDTVGLKFMFPEDRVIDYVYRQSVGENYEHVPDRPDGYYNGLLFFAIHAMDFAEENDDPGELELGRTFFCGERALMMTRSDWTTEALMLNLHTRQANGGHPYADRNSIHLCGAGRVWSPIHGARAYENFRNSVVVVEGRAQSRFTPGRMVDFVDEEQATFAVGDAKFAWDWNWLTKDRPGGFYTAEDVRAGRVELAQGEQLEPRTPNDFAYTKQPFAYLDVPMSETPHWRMPHGAVRPVVRVPNTRMRYAYRTAGIVRGAQPYALVVDDIRKDSMRRRYEWILTLEPDIQMVSLTPGADGQLDILLTGDDPAQQQGLPKEDLPPERDPAHAVPQGQPMLLVRVLQREHHEARGEARPWIDVVRDDTPKTQVGPVRRLVIPAESVEPKFKVLLFPHRKGDALPKTEWNADKTKLLVTMADGQQDEIALAKSDSGKTHLVLTRGGAQLAAVNADPPPPLD